MKKSDRTTTYSKVEILGKILILGVGLILVVGNLLFSWKLQTWSYDSWGIYPNNHQALSNLIFMNILFHIPCIAGFWMVFTVIKYFRKDKDYT